MNSLLPAGACHCVVHHGPHGALFISNPPKLMNVDSLWRGLMHRGWPNVDFRGHLYSASLIILDVVAKWCGTVDRGHMSLAMTQVGVCVSDFLHPNLLSRCRALHRKGRSEY
jgi:hypothetical protein